MKRFARLSAAPWFLALGVITSCNIYSPFTSQSSTNDHLEAALECLHNNDFDCAIENYNKLPDGQLKSQKLCTGYLAKAGFTLGAFLNIVTKNEATMLGQLANTLVPWSSLKGTDAATAKDHCLAYYNANVGEGLADLLRTMGVFVDCAMRMAKTDQFVAISDSDTDCNTTGNQDGTINQSDIGASDGTISNSTPGMCAADVTICQDSVGTLKTDDDSGTVNLEDAGITDIGAALDQIPDEFKSSVTATVRKGIFDSTPN